MTTIRWPVFDNRGVNDTDRSLFTVTVRLATPRAAGADAPVFGCSRVDSVQVDEAGDRNGEARGIRFFHPGDCPTDPFGHTPFDG